MTVELEILRLGSRKEGDVRLVPDFEMPVAHFIRAVPVEKGLYRCAHQFAPGMEILRRTGGTLAGEDGFVVACQPPGQEAKLNKRLDAGFQVIVVIVEEILEGFYFLPDREQYSDTLGLVIDSHWLEEILI